MKEVVTPLVTSTSLPSPAALADMQASGDSLDLYLSYYGVSDRVGTALMKALEMTSKDHFSIAAGISDSEYEELLKTLTVRGTSLTLGMRARIRMTIRCVKTLSGVRHEPMPQHTIATTATYSAVEGAVHSADRVGEPNSVSLADTVLQTSSAVVKKLDPATIRQYRRRYYSIHDEWPAEEEDISEEQLTGLYTVVFVLRSIYVDFAIWVAFWSRMVRRKRFTATMVNEFGEIIQVEILGPPTFESWETSYTCFGTGVTMLNVISPGLQAQSKLGPGSSRMSGSY